MTATASFVKDLGPDELALVELVMAYEREFKIEIPDADADQFRQVRDVVAYLRVGALGPADAWLPQCPPLGHSLMLARIAPLGFDSP